MHACRPQKDLTLDYNTELFPLQADQQIALALASSLSRGPGTGGDEEDSKDTAVWRPDGKGRRGLEEEYEYVMYGKVCFLICLYVALVWSKPDRSHG